MISLGVRCEASFSWNCEREKWNKKVSCTKRVRFLFEFSCSTLDNVLMNIIGRRFAEQKGGQKSVLVVLNRACGNHKNLVSNGA